jgi:hypothetical protein
VGTVVVELAEAPDDAATRSDSSAMRASASSRSCFLPFALGFVGVLEG